MGRQQAETDTLLQAVYPPGTGKRIRLLRHRQDFCAKKTPRRPKRSHANNTVRPTKNKDRRHAEEDWPSGHSPSPNNPPICSSTKISGEFPDKDANVKIRLAQLVIEKE